MIQIPLNYRGFDIIFNVEEYDFYPGYSASWDEPGMEDEVDVTEATISYDLDAQANKVTFDWEEVYNDNLDKITEVVLDYIYKSDAEAEIAHYEWVNRVLEC